MKKQKILLLAIPLLAMSACAPLTSTNENYKKVISPSGAPAICFYDQANSGNFDTNSTPSNVMAQLMTDNYGMVVFDFYNGLKAIKNNNAIQIEQLAMCEANLMDPKLNEVIKTPEMREYIRTMEWKYRKNDLPPRVFDVSAPVPPNRKSGGR